MKLAGYVEEVSQNNGEIPTYAEAGITKQPEPKPIPAKPTEAEREATYQREVNASKPPTSAPASPCAASVWITP